MCSIKQELEGEKLVTTSQNKQPAVHGQEKASRNFVNEVGRKTYIKTSKKEKTSKIQKNIKKMKTVYVKIT